MLVHLIPHAIRLVKEYPWLLPVVLGYLAVSAWLGFTFLLVATIVATLGLGAVLWYRDYKDSKREYRVVIRDPHGAPIYDTYRGRRPRDFGKGARTDSSRLFVLDDGDDGGEIIRGLVWPPVFLRGPPRRPQRSRSRSGRMNCPRASRKRG